MGALLEDIKVSSFLIQNGELCLRHPSFSTIGDIRPEVSYVSIPLLTVMDERIWRPLGNGQFRFEFAYDFLRVIFLPAIYVCDPAAIKARYLIQNSELYLPHPSSSTIEDIWLKNLDANTPLFPRWMKLSTDPLKLGQFRLGSAYDCRGFFCSLHFNCTTEDVKQNVQCSLE